MITVRTLYDLKKCVAQFVYVHSQQAIFKLQNNEYVERRYFSVNEAASMLETTQHTIRYHIKKNKWKTKLTLEQIRLLM